MKAFFKSVLNRIIEARMAKVERMLKTRQFTY